MEKNLKHIVLIDDDEINNFLSQEIIAMHSPGTKVSAFTQAGPAMDYLSETLEAGKALPDIILLDINMPVMDGWEFLEAVGKIAEHPAFRPAIYIYTSSVYEADRTRAGSFAFVKKLFSKPLDQQILDEIMV